MTMISVVEMRKRIVEMLDFAIQEDGLDAVKLEYDLYWNVSGPERYEPDETPVPGLGSMDFDWEMALTSEPGSRAHLIYFSEILRYIALRA